MGSGPINSWQIDGETVETVTDFIFGGSKITVDGDCNHEIQKHLLLGRSYDPPRQRIKKQRHYFVKKGLSSQSYGFSIGHVWMWELDCKESWVPKNCCFWTVVLEKTLRVHWTARRSNQSILKEIGPESSSEGLMLKLKMQYFGHLLWRTASFEKTLMLGKIEGKRRGWLGWDGWMASLTQQTWVWVNSGGWWWTGRPGVLQSMVSQRVGHGWVTELKLRNYWF